MFLLLKVLTQPLTNEVHNPKKSAATLRISLIHRSRLHYLHLENQSILSRDFARVPTSGRPSVSICS